MIAHVAATYLFNTGSWIHSQVRFQTTYRSLVLALRRENEEQFPCDRVYTLQAMGPWRWRLERLARKLWAGYYPYHCEVARRQHVRLLHAHFGGTGLSSLPLARALGVPLVTSFYGADMSAQRDGVDLARRYAPLFEAGQRFLVEGPAAKHRLESLGCAPEKILIQRLGVDLDSIAYCPRALAEDAPVRVLMAATFTEKKGLAYGVEAFCQAAREDARLKLTVVGDARPGRLDEIQIKRELHSLVSLYGMAERVAFRGYVSLAELRQMAYEHCIFLHPSVTATSGDSEGGSPVVITEMAASGLPVVATHHCDIPEVVLDGETGLLAEERNVEQLRRALLRLAADGDLRLRLGARGRQHVAEHYCARRQGQRLGEIYSELIGPPGVVVL